MDLRQDGARGLNGDSKIQTLERSEDTRPDLQASKVTGLDRWLVRKLLTSSGNPPVHVVLWNGEEVATSPAAPVGRVRLHDRKTLLKILVNPDLGFGDGYSGGQIEVEGDLVEILEELYRAAAAAPVGFVKHRLLRWLNRPRMNSLRGSRENIHHHYDIGNEFYKLWLDEELVYTCAYFPT